MPSAGRTVPVGNLAPCQRLPAHTCVGAARGAERAHRRKTREVLARPAHLRARRFPEGMVRPAEP